MAITQHKCDAAIIGAGPTGLMAAEELARAGYTVEIFERMPTPARKFLMAGKSGLNITHSEDLSIFTSRYGKSADNLTKPIEAFSNIEIRKWVEDLGIETFVGSSGRVFPKAFKASPLLRAWLHRLNDMGVKLHLRTNWQGWDPESNNLMFMGPNGALQAQAGTTVLALGGTSWPKLGSNGEWQQALRDKAVKLEPFRPSNCGFNIKWSDYFRERYAGEPIKNCILNFAGTSAKGDVMVTANGIEGGTVYKLSAPIVEALGNNQPASITIDLTPDRSTKQLEDRLAQPQGKRSLSDHIRRKTGLKGVQIGLLREFAAKEAFSSAEGIAGLIKSISIPIKSVRPIEEAISVAGGVSFDGLDENLMLTALPGTFCAGEMVAWDAPTGGYLLTACLAQGKQAAVGAAAWLDKMHGAQDKC